MTNRERIILGFSDAEILRFWQMFAYCPHHQHQGRLERMLGGRFNSDSGEMQSRLYAMENLLSKPMPRRGVA